MKAEVTTNMVINFNGITKNQMRVTQSGKTVSQEEMEQEWLLIQAAQANPAKFQPLYKRYYEPIFRFIYKRTLDEATSADICSQVFLKALQKLGGYSFKGVPFSAWLFRIASNEVTQYFRNNQKKRVVSVDDSSFKDVEDNVFEDVFSDEKRQVLLDTLQTLKEDDLKLIEMRFFEKRPFKEIANILQMTESNTKVKTYRILQRLKKKLLNSAQFNSDNH